MLFVAVIASMGIIADTRIQLALSLLSAGLVLLAYFVFRRGRSGGASGRTRREPRTPARDRRSGKGAWPGGGFVASIPPFCAVELWETTF